MKRTEQRRGFIKALTACIAATPFIGTGFAPGAVAQQKRLPDSSSANTLVLYFSQTGRTRYLANEIHKRVGGSIYELKTVIPYKGSYDELTVIAKAEQRRRYRPELAGQLPDLRQFDTIFLGFPTWWSTMPMAMFTLLEQHDLSDKNIIPFVTHGGSGLARAPKDIRALCPDAQHFKGLAIYGDYVQDRHSQSEVDQWLSELPLDKRSA